MNVIKWKNRYYVKGEHEDGRTTLTTIPEKKGEPRVKLVYSNNQEECDKAIKELERQRRLNIRELLDKFIKEQEEN